MGSAGGYSKLENTYSLKNVQRVHIHIVLDPPNFQEKPEILIFKG